MNKLEDFIKHVCDLGYVGRGPKLEKVIENLLMGLRLPHTVQPNGSQQFPDFHILNPSSSVIMFFLEAKSSNDGIPSWNTGYPKPDTIYIISSQKHNRTTCVLGQDLISPEAREKCESAKTESKSYNRLHTDGLKYYGWSAYFRVQFYGENVFKDENLRIEREQRVLDFVRRFIKNSA